MLPGPILIRKCKHCSQLISQSFLASYNSSDTVIRSDGIIDSPMLPRATHVDQCLYGNAILCIHLHARIKEVDCHQWNERLTKTNPLIKELEALKAVQAQYQRIPLSDS